MPDWVKSAYEEYAKRLPRECRLQLVEIPAGQRGKGADMARAIQTEGERVLAAIPKEARVIALDMRGKQWDTPQLAQQLKDWLQGGHDIALLIGGPEGLAESCLKRAQSQWSLSKLTLTRLPCSSNS